MITAKSAWCDPSTPLEQGGEEGPGSQLGDPQHQTTGPSWSAARLAPAVWGLPVVVPPAGEYVADGAARQAAWVLGGAAVPPAWHMDGLEVRTAEPTPDVMSRHDEAARTVDARWS